MAEEEKKGNPVPTPDPVTTAANMRAHSTDTNQFRQAFEQRQQAAQGNINNAFDSSVNRVQAGLQDSLQQNTQAQDAATAAGQKTFDFAKEDLGTQAGRTQTDMNRYADVRGLNRQPGSQQALSLGLAASTAAGRLARQQQMALEEGERQKAMLSTDYNNRVQAAIADRDYKKAAALLDDYNNQNAWLDKNAEIAAGFGNYTIYEQLYGPDTAGMMRNFWIGSNPEMAYNTGVIDAKRFQEMTGRPAPGSTSAGGGGYDWWDPYSVGGMSSGGGGGGSGGGGGVTPH